MKISLTITIILFNISIAFAQAGRVGINTETPKTTLDVTGKIGTDGKSLPDDITGLQAPRLTREELTNKALIYGADQKGTLIYITDISGGDAGATTPRKNITSVGYYYFDGTDWIKIVTGNVSTSDIHIYKEDGTLTSDRTVTMDGKSLTFESTNEQTIISKISGILQEGKNNVANIQLSSPDKNANGKKSNLYLQSYSENSAQILAGEDANSLVIGTHYTSAAAPIRFITTNSANVLGTEKARITGDGKMGIGETTPTNTLHVKAASDPVKFEGLQTSSSSSDKVLVADTNGVLKTTSLFIPFTSLIGLKVNQDAVAGTASTFKTIVMENNPVIAGMTYNSTTGIYTVNSPGYYQISASVSANVASPGDGTASFTLLKNGSTVNRVDTASGIGATFTNQNMTYLVQFAANDTFSMQYAFTRAFRITTAQVSAIKVSN